MSATDELRRMLTESGVEWDYGITGTASTMFNANGVELTFIDMRDGVTCSTILTPAQAIAVTLGPRSDSCNCTNGERINLAVTLVDADATPTRQDGVEMCHVMTIGEFNGEGTEYYDVCSNCGYEFDDDPLNYCPNCGRRMVAE